MLHPEQRSCTQKLAFVKPRKIVGGDEPSAGRATLMPRERNREGQFRLFLSRKNWSFGVDLNVLRCDRHEKIVRKLMARETPVFRRGAKKTSCEKTSYGRLIAEKTSCGKGMKKPPVKRGQKKFPNDSSLRLLPWGDFTANLYIIRKKPPVHHGRGSTVF